MDFINLVILHNEWTVQVRGKRNGDEKYRIQNVYPKCRSNILHYIRFVNQNKMENDLIL